LKKARNIIATFGGESQGMLKQEDRGIVELSVTSSSTRSQKTGGRKWNKTDKSRRGD